jgi:hypothetical protein
MKDLKEREGLGALRSSIAARFRDDVVDFRRPRSTL